MTADFSGYATKNDLRCSDGRIIRSDAFKHNDGIRVPLVWDHKKDGPSNILGHAILEHRNDGVYTYGYFNDTPAGVTARNLVSHGDISQLSIHANQLVQKGDDVVHGMIREVSLVIAGANPGAFIDNVTISHGDNVLVDEEAGYIYTGLDFEHSGAEDDEEELEEEELNHADDAEEDDEDEDETVKDIYNSMSPKQKAVVGLIAEEAANAAVADAEKGDAKSEKKDAVDHSADSEDDESTDNVDDSLQHGQEGTEMPRNVFEGQETSEKNTLTHSQVDEIFSAAKREGSLKDSFLEHAATYGFDDVDVLFPDAKALNNTPELIARRMEWVNVVMSETKHSPFARIKTINADITADEARARGYVKGSLKKEEIIKLLKRVTTPTTIYKKQKMDRDDIIDITGLDVVSWLKGEMRVMLEEEIARAILLGDGREVDAEGKIDEDHIRPIASDADMYTHKVVLASNVSPEAVISEIIRSRTKYRGTGTPTLFTTDSLLVDMLMEKDKIGRRLYNSEAELAAALRVAKIVPVEVMEDYTDFLAIMVNLADYTIGADKGGAVSMFDDFDIDYNQEKYLIETRISGALIKPKSAVVIKRVAGTFVTPTAPSFDGATNTLTIPSVTGVVYKIDGVVKPAGPIEITETTEVFASPATGYAFANNTQADWVYVYTQQ